MKSSLTVVLSLCALSACAHREPADRATVSTVGNRDVTGESGSPDNKKMHYTKVSNEDALRNGAQDATGVASREQNATANATSSQSTCDLNVYFETASAQLNQRAKQQLDSIASCLKRHEAHDALIVGSADPRGSEPYNEKLGKERARVVGHYLRELGIPNEDIRIRSAGESQASNQPAIWPADRNAQIRKQQ